MRVLALHPDVLVVTSAVWQTTCTVLRSDEEGFVIDSPVLPHELEALPALVAQAQFPLSGLLATHGDWDHVLARIAFPDAALGVAETTAARLTGRPGDAQRELRRFDEEHYVERPPLRLGELQALPVPGTLDVGERSLRLIPADGHTEDGMAVWADWAGVLIAGDYLSPVEIPVVRSASAYAATLERLRPFVEQADRVVPGHGGVLDGGRALAILREDLRYLETGELPLARRGPAQQRIHERNPL